MFVCVCVCLCVSNSHFLGFVCLCVHLFECFFCAYVLFVCVFVFYNMCDFVCLCENTRNVDSWCFVQREAGNKGSQTS